AILLAIFPLPSTWIETHYSNGFYPQLQTALTPITNRAPFAVVDLLVAGLVLAVVCWWIARIKKTGRGRRWKRAGGLFFHTLAIAELILLCFQTLWGFNYSREPLTRKLDYDEARLSKEALKNLKRLTAERLNAESGEVHNNPWPSEQEWRNHLLASFDST